VFPNAACVVSLIDRLVHRCEIVAIDGESYRLKEAKARSEKKAASRAAAPAKVKHHDTAQTGDGTAITGRGQQFHHVEVVNTLDGRPGFGGI
jgi:hypothetical protein